ncbi:TraR/DksA family transcriptional regulator [Nocardioides sp. YIM 152588]|uniref:TraR/DksA family transcriptional regulator n=1 Tax=Nocardioides sp. YIM 152588 TaxID=3158259 RepID=UPI0032E4F466
MARIPKKSLAGQAATAARRVIKQRPRTGAEESGAVAPAANGEAAASAPAATPARKAPAKKAPAKKAATKKAAPAAKTSGPAKKAAPAVKKSAPAKKTASKRTAAARKSAAKKAATRLSTSDLVVREGEDPWTADELAEVIEELHEQREHSAELLADQEADLSGLLRDAGDGAGHDQADVGATSFERDHELTVVNHEREKIAQIDRALGRLDDGTYGACESCGNPVGKMRLMAFPRATLCMTCKQREERR